VNSHYTRILAQNPAISGHNANDAVSGAKMTNLAGQMQTVVSQQPEYVTVLMGGNDVCTDTVDQMTSVADFNTQLRAGLAVLHSGDPNALVFVASVPDAYHLWQILKDNSSARAAWSAYDVCQSLLANPLSTDPSDVARRATVRQRNIDFNTVLAQACADYGPNCLFDANAVFNYPFATSDINTHDYFHPSLSGQATLASITWTASFWGSGAPPPVISLTASLGVKSKNRQPVNLAWSGATGAQVDVYRNGSLLTATANDGAYTDSLNPRQHGTFTYRVCLTGSSTCSNDASVTI
jgi:hypothetical protein